MKFFERDLRIKITAIMLALVLLAQVATFVVTYSLTNAIITNNVESWMLESARMSRNLLEVALERRGTRMELLASDPILRDPASDPAARNTALERFHEAWPLGTGGGIVMLDTAGNVISGTGEFDSMGNAGNTSWFKAAETARPSLAFITDPTEFPGLTVGVPQLSSSSPVRDMNDQIFGFVVAFTDLADVKKAVSSVSIEETGHAFLVNGRREVIAGDLFGLTASAAAADREKVDSLIDRMTGGRTGQLSFSVAGKRYLVTYVPVEQSGARHPEVDWAIGVAVPSGEVYAPAQTLSWFLIGLNVLILLLICFAAILLGRSISRPIEELAVSAERMGSGDLTGEVVIRSRDQIGTLAAALLRMRDYLRTALSEAARSSEKMSVLADEQSAATVDTFNNIEEIVESVVVLARNMESQTQKIRKIRESAQLLPEQITASKRFEEVAELLSESEILAEVGSDKAVEIASASQEERAAVRDVATAARRLSEMARELNEMVERFKI